MFHVEQFWSKIKTLWKNQPDLVIFGIFVFFIPVGSSKFITVLLPYSDQVFNVWTGAFVYFSDILLVAVLALWLIRWLRGRFVLGNNVRFIRLLLVTLTAILVISTVVSDSSYVSWYGVIRWVEGFVLCGYTLVMITTWRRRLMVCVLFFAAMSVQAIVAVIQFATQQSLGLKWLGESVLNTSIPNVAEVIAQGDLWLRAYGTQPHPNALAYLLIISLMLAIYLYARIKTWNWRITISALAGLQIMVLIMTFSRTAWSALFVGFGALIVLLLVWHRSAGFLHRITARSVIPLLLTGIISIVAVIAMWPMISNRFTAGDLNGDLAVSYRQQLNSFGWDRIAANPILGIGPKQFVPSLTSNPEILAEPWRFQPIHNNYLLISVESGILGLGVFVVIIITKFVGMGSHLRNVPRGTFCQAKTDVLYVFIILGCLTASVYVMFFDHYIQDIQQSSLTFWLLMGL